MLIVPPDFDRRIDLPNAGPCPRPIDIDQAVTGFAELVSLRIYSFAQGMVIDGEAEEDEVFITLMRGAADFRITQAGLPEETFALRTDGGPRAFYMPPHSAYQLTAVADCDIAYARVRPPVPAFPAARGFAPDGDRLTVPDHAAGMALVFETMPAGATLALTGVAGDAPERLVHIRAQGGSAAIAGQPLGDWHAAALPDGEHATLTAEGGTVDVLAISAKARRS